MDGITNLLFTPSVIPPDYAFYVLNMHSIGTHHHHYRHHDKRFYDLDNILWILQMRMQRDRDEQQQQKISSK